MMRTGPCVRESDTETETEGNRAARGRGEPEPPSSDSGAPTMSLTTSLQTHPSVNTTQRGAPGLVAVSTQTEGQLPGGVVGGGDGAGAVTPTPLGPRAPQAAQMSSLGRHLSAGHGSRCRNRGRHRPGSFTHKDGTRDGRSSTPSGGAPRQGPCGLCLGR